MEWWQITVIIFSSSISFIGIIYFLWKLGYNNISARKGDASFTLRRNNRQYIISEEKLKNLRRSYIELSLDKSIDDINEQIEELKKEKINLPVSRIENTLNIIVSKFLIVMKENTISLRKQKQKSKFKINDIDSDFHVINYKYVIEYHIYNMFFSTFLKLIKSKDFGTIEYNTLQEIINNCMDTATQIAEKEYKGYDPSIKQIEEWNLKVLAYNIDSSRPLKNQYKDIDVVKEIMQELLRSQEIWNELEGQIQNKLKEKELIRKKNTDKIIDLYENTFGEQNE